MGWLARSLGGVALTGAMVAPALSQTVTELLTVTSFSVGGWSITLSGCTSSGATSCSTDQVVATATPNALSLVFQGSSGGNLETAATGTVTDLTFNGDITVTAPGSEPIYLAGANVSGTAASGTTADKQRVTVSSGNVQYGTQSTPLPAKADLTTSPTLQSVVFAPTHSVSSVPDFKSNASQATGSLTLASATLVYDAPEPVSVSLVASAIAGLGFVRRKTRPRP